MYQVSWSVENHSEQTLEDFFVFMDTYDEVEQWMGDIQKQDHIHHWTVSMVLEGSDPQHEEVYPEDPVERGIWQHNAMMIAMEGEYHTRDPMERGAQVMRALSMLPKKMAPPEIFATVMNLLGAYFDNKDEQIALLQSCLGSMDAVHSAREKVKKNAKRMLN